MPNCPIHLHDLLVRLLELEDKARKELTRQAHSVAVARMLDRGKVSSGNKLSKKQQTFLKSVQEGRRSINEVYRSDQALWFAYRLQLSQAENDLAAPLVRDGKVVVKGKLQTRLTPLNLALRELVIAGIGIDERQIHEYLLQLNPIWGRGPDPSIARVIADLHEKGVTNTILRRLRREHTQVFKSEPFLRCGGRAGEMGRVLQDTDKPLRREHSGSPVAQCGPENRLVELLVNLELTNLRRECTVTTTAARCLLDDSKFRSEILRARFSDPKGARHKDLTFSVSERRELRDFAGGGMGFPNFSVGDKVRAAMILATGEVENEILQHEAEDYIERGGSFVDWHRHGDHPLDEYVLIRIEAKLSEIIEEPHGALHVFIIRTIEGCAAKHEDIRSALDRLVRDGFADELLRDVWERYPIEAQILYLPTPSEAQPIESAALKPPPLASARLFGLKPGETPADRQQNIDPWLEKMIPLLNTHDSDKWIISSAAAELLRVKSPALRVDRAKNRAKYQHSQVTCGIDGKGRWWRKELGKQNVWYYLSSFSGNFKHRDAQPEQPLRATPK